MTAQEYSGFTSRRFFAPPNVTLAALPFALAAPAVPSLLLFNTSLVLPSLSVFALASAAIVALLAWGVKSKRHSAHITLWDLSGVYAFVGFAAGMLSEPQHVLEFWSLPTSDHGVTR